MNERSAVALVFAGALLIGCGDGGGGGTARPWAAQGPAPALGGQVTLAAQGDPVAGAVNVVLPHPENAEVVWIAAVNGGVWRTENAGSPIPIWTPLTDDQASLSIGALQLDPTDPSLRTLVAGIGRRSSFRRTQADASGFLPGFGGPLTGLLHSRDGGDTWTAVGEADLSGRNIVGVAARGARLLAATDQLATGGGLYGSIDGGRHFGLISGAPLSRLPAGAVTDLASDPSDIDRFYAAVLTAGVFRSDDGGATWSNVTDPAAANLFNANTQNVKISVHASAAGYAVFVGIAVNDVGAAGFFRFDGAGPPWQSLGVPQTVESGISFGLITETDNGSGVIHFSLEADRNDPNLVYIGGDAQPSGDGNQLPDPVWPNSIGSINYTGRLFRGDAAQPLASVWTPLTDDFARPPGQPGTGPHADSRDMAFDAAGHLLEADDGGVFRRTGPASPQGAWSALNGTLQITEFHSVAWDRNTQTILAGAQDVGVPEQAASSAVAPWRTVVQCDGGKVAVDASTPGASLRYSSIYLLQMAERRTVDAANRVIDTQVPAFIVEGTGQSITVVDPTLQFYSPLVLNVVDPNRLLIGSSNLYESFDQGDTLIELGELGAPVGGTTFGVPMVYGGTRAGIANPDVIYVGAGSTLFLRTTRGEPPMALTAYPGGDIADIALSPEDWTVAYVIDSTDVYRTTNAGQTWRKITGSLQFFYRRSAQQDAPLQTVAVLPGNPDRVVVGGVSGVHAATARIPAAWSRFGTGLPNAVVMDLVYDPVDDLLLAGTLGRGAWTLSDAAP